MSSHSPTRIAKSFSASVSWPRTSASSLFVALADATDRADSGVENRGSWSCYWLENGISAGVPAGVVVGAMSCDYMRQIVWAHKVETNRCFA